MILRKLQNDEIQKKNNFLSVQLINGKFFFKFEFIHTNDLKESKPYFSKENKSMIECPSETEIGFYSRTPLSTFNQIRIIGPEPEYFSFNESKMDKDGMFYSIIGLKYSLHQPSIIVTNFMLEERLYFFAFYYFEENSENNEKTENPGILKIFLFDFLHDKISESRLKIKNSQLKSSNFIYKSKYIFDGEKKPKEVIYQSKNSEAFRSILFIDFWRIL